VLTCSAGVSCCAGVALSFSMDMVSQAIAL
jgi:hypothetical protein